MIQTPQAFRKVLRRGRLGLSGRLLVLTILFVTLAEIMIYLPALVSYRRSLLNDRISAAHIAALILDSSSTTRLTPEAEMKVLQGVGVRYLAFGSAGIRNVLADGPMTPDVAYDVNLMDRSWFRQLRSSVGDLLFGTNGNLRVMSDVPGVEFVEIIIDRSLLQRDLVVFSRVFLGYSLFLSLVTAALLYWVLQWMIISPVVRLSRNVTRFAEQPEDSSRIIQPTGRGDEIGLTEEALAHMERSLADELRKKRRLAELGLAVSKINHELRNILTTAQLLTDRLEGIADDVVQRIAPRLMRVLDRAISFCEATLAYGRAQEKEPQREVFAVHELIQDIEEMAGFAPHADIKMIYTIPQEVMIDADREQLTRVLLNLVRNARQAHSSSETQWAKLGAKFIEISAQETKNATLIRVSDNGPGVPEALRAKLFQPFQSDSSLKGGVFSGTGLGLVIAQELISAHGGHLALTETRQGAIFEIWVPKQNKP